MTILVYTFLVGCQTSSNYTNVTTQSNQKPAPSIEQQRCMELAEPSYKVSQADKKRSHLKFFAEGCFDTLAGLNLKTKKYSFGDGYHTEGMPEPFESERLLKDLLDDGGDLPRNEQMALGVAKALIGRGVPEAEIYLGSEFQATEPKKAEQYFTYAAMQDKCVAQAHLAYSYYEGAFTERNLAKSYFWALQLLKKRTAGEDLDVWRPAKLRSYYTGIKGTFIDFEGAIAFLMNQYQGQGLCSFAMSPTTLERTFSDADAKQQVKNLAMFWQIGDQVPAGLNNIAFKENDYKVAQAKKAIKEEKQVDSLFDTVVKYSRPFVRLNELSEIRDTAELYRTHNKSVYFIAASKSERAFKLGKVATGTAIAISQSQLLTNCHILENRNYAVISADDDAVYEAKLVQADFDKDTCVVALENQLADFQTNFRTIDSLNVGEQVFAIGNPSGLTKSLSTGVISGIRELNGTQIIQTNTEISGGSSGGGLYDQMGNLIGITSFGLQNAEGLNFAIAIDEFVSFENAN